MELTFKERLQIFGGDLLRRLNRIRKEMVTRLNAIGMLVALYALANPEVSDKILGFVPEGQRPIAAVVFPLIWFWLVQKGKEVDKAKTVEKARANLIEEIQS